MNTKYLWLVYFLICLTYVSEAQKGFLFGGGLGIGILHLKTTNAPEKDHLALSLPNLRFGYRFNKKFAMIGVQPGSVYSLKSKDRVFEAIHLIGQYWIKDRFWISGGTGINFDGPAFYTWGDKDKEGLYTGFPSVSLSTGYEVWRKNNFALDIQYRFFYGRSQLEANLFRSGNSSSIILGINWY